LYADHISKSLSLHVEILQMAQPAVQPFQQPKREYQPLKPEDLSNFVADPEVLKLPAGFHWYETMIVLRASINDQDRCGRWRP
jgi:hypothetical protein